MDKKEFVINFEKYMQKVLLKILLQNGSINEATYKKTEKKINSGRKDVA